MQIDIERKLFTRDDFSKMYESGSLDEDDRVELIDGEVIQMTNPGRRHVECSLRATSVLTERLGRRAIVSVQNPLVLDDYNEPKPDVVVLAPREDFYASADVSFENALLVIEISDSTLAKDRKRKLPIYARCGVKEFWIEDLKHNVLLVFRDSSGNDYQTRLTLQRGETVTPLAFPDVNLQVKELLG